MICSLSQESPEIQTASGFLRFTVWYEHWEKTSEPPTGPSWMIYFSIRILGGDPVSDTPKCGGRNADRLGMGKNPIYHPSSSTFESHQISQGRTLGLWTLGDSSAYSGVRPTRLWIQIQLGLDHPKRGFCQERNGEWLHKPSVFAGMDWYSMLPTRGMWSCLEMDDAPSLFWTGKKNIHCHSLEICSPTWVHFAYIP